MKLKRKIRVSEGDVEIDRRIYGDHTIVLLEDRASKMMLPDRTSKQYILAVERISKEGNRNLDHKRYISRLIVKKGYENAKEGARAIFLHPGDFKSVLGKDWFPFTHSGKVEI